MGTVCVYMHAQYVLLCPPITKLVGGWRGTTLSIYHLKKYFCLKFFVHRLKKQKLMGFDDHFMIYAMVYTCTDSFLSNLLTWWKNKIEMYQTLFWSKGSASSVEVTRDKLIQDETMLQTV